MINNDLTVLKVLKQIESDYPVEDLVIDNIYIWPLLKIKIAFENASRDIAAAPRPRKLSSLKKFSKSFFKVIFAYFIDYKKNDVFRKVDILFLSDSINRRMKNAEGEYVDIFTDIIANKLAKESISTLSLERCPANTILTPRAFKSIWIDQKLLWIRFILRIKKIPSIEVKSNTLRAIQEYLTIQGLRSFSLTEDAIAKEVFYLKELKKTFIKILNKTSPKAVLQTDWYSVGSLALSLACKDFGIPLIDYQHGVQGSHHIAYGGWVKPFSDQASISLFPDIFLCWSEEDKKNILTWLPSSRGKVYNVGNIYLNDFKSGDIQFGEIEYISNLSSNIGNLKTVCITLQPFYGLNESILTQIEILGPAYFFLIRLHPSMLKEINIYENELEKKFPWLKYSITLATKTPLPILLQRSSLHITYNSSVVIEASLLGVPSVILDHDLGPKLFSKYLESRSAQLGPIKNGLIEGIELESGKPIDILTVIKSIISKEVK